MDSKKTNNTELSKLENQRKMYLLKKLQELNEKKKSVEELNFQRFASIIFVKDKFKISNEFNHKGIKNFLKEKFEYLKPMNLDDSLIEVKNHHKEKHSKHDDEKVTKKKKVSKYQSNLFDSEVPRIPVKNTHTNINRLFSSNSQCLQDFIDNLI